MIEFSSDYICICMSMQVDLIQCRRTSLLHGRGCCNAGRMAVLVSAYVCVGVTAEGGDVCDDVGPGCGIGCVCNVGGGAGVVSVWCADGVVSVCQRCDCVRG